MTNDSLLGKTLGPYEIIEPIGQGGMATVYKAVQSNMNRTVAIKILSPQMASNATFLARFKQEAQMIASLEHAHILPVYDLGEQDGVVYIAMRYMGHGSIQSRLSAGPMALKDVARWIEQIASALDYAHERGVIHRDVKPSNVLIDAQGNAFLADFGIAKWMEGSINLTGSSVIGTPQYMSPEQGQGLKSDGRSDEYALGVMAYEMIVGRPPFEAETPLAVVLKHVTEPLTPPSVMNPRVPVAVSDVIVKSLHKNPDDRYPTTVAFAEALSMAIQSAPAPGTALLPISAASTEQVHLTQMHPSRRPVPRRPIAITLLLLLSVVLGVGGAVFIAANTPTPDRPIAVVTVGPNVLIETVTPSSTAVATALPITTSAPVASAASCVPIFSETFDTPSPNLPSGEQEGSAWGIVEGEYRLLIKSANFFQSRLMGPALKDYAVESDARFASKALGDYGLMVAAHGESDYIAFVIDGDSNYAVMRRTPAGSTVIQDWRFSSALKAGNETNHLRAIQRGREIALYANGVLLKLINDEGDSTADRSVGFTAASFGQGGVDVRFHNLRICQAPTSLASSEVTLIDAFDDNRNGWSPRTYSANGSTAIENGKFTVNAIYSGTEFGWSEWNPNVAFNNFDLELDLQMTEAVTNSQIGILFGVQDLSNYYLFRMVKDGSFRLDRRAADSYQAIADTQFSAAIKPDLGLNHVHISVVTGTLKIDVNRQPILQAAIAYSPGFVGFWCGAYAPRQTRCTFDNLAVKGTPSTELLTAYPFCNCLREAHLGQPIVVSWRFDTRTEDLLKTWQAKITTTVALDNEVIAQPQQYWDKPQKGEGEFFSFWRYNLPQLEAGSHVLQYTVHSDVALTDGKDKNGDGKPDAYGPGDIYVGYVEIEVLP